MPTSVPPVMRDHEAFLRMDLSEYEGKWIAIVDEVVVAADESLKKAYYAAKRKFPSKDPLIARAPPRRIMILPVSKR